MLDLIAETIHGRLGGCRAVEAERIGIRHSLLWYGWDHDTWSAEQFIEGGLYYNTHKVPKTLGLMDTHTSIMKNSSSSYRMFHVKHCTCVKPKTTQPLPPNRHPPYTRWYPLRYPWHQLKTRSYWVWYPIKLTGNPFTDLVTRRYPRGIHMHQLGSHGSARRPRVYPTPK